MKGINGVIISFIILLLTTCGKREVRKFIKSGSPPPVNLEQSELIEEILKDDCKFYELQNHHALSSLIICPTMDNYFVTLEGDLVVNNVFLLEDYLNYIEEEQGGSSEQNEDEQTTDDDGENEDSAEDEQEEDGEDDNSGADGDDGTETNKEEKPWEISFEDYCELLKSKDKNKRCVEWKWKLYKWILFKKLNKKGYQ